MTAETSSVDSAPVAHESFPTTNAGILKVLHDLHGGIPDSWHRGTIAHEFWANVRKGDGCWPWIGAERVVRYGMFVFGGQRMKAHRMSWELTNGPIPDGLFVCHHCDYPPCVRPDHLFLGTATDNTADFLAKARAGTFVSSWERRVVVAAKHGGVFALMFAVVLLSACHDPHTLSTARQLVEVGGMLVVSAVVIWAIAALVGFAFEREPALDDTTDELDGSVVHHEIRTTIAGSYCQVRCICGQWNATVPTVRGARELFHLHEECAHAPLAGGAA